MLLYKANLIMLNDHDVTFVIQGLVLDTTKTTVSSIRKIFPESYIILSTWIGQDTASISVDKIIENDDVGGTVTRYNKYSKPHTVNVNRQIVSSFNGLKSVDTKYAVKIRSDNGLISRGMLKYFNVFDEHRDPNYTIFKQRIVTSNYFAKEYMKGLNIPFYISDFFQFGETKDLIDLWDVELFDNYFFNNGLNGKLQHENVPFRQHHIEQKLWLKFINKYSRVELKDKFGDRELRKLSYKYMLNNVVIVDGDLLGLSVPQRLEQDDGFPYENFTYLRWHYLYKKYFYISEDISKRIKFKWFIAMVYRFFRRGWKSYLKGVFDSIKT
ncbi:MAG: hypothetical protein ACJA0H_001404 [Francisellaceae bacterium]|jgi:hypothetical protein